MNGNKGFNSLIFKNMKQLIILFLAFLFVPISVNALSVRSSYNSLSGTTDYTFDDGTTAYSYKESLTGNTKYYLSDGSYGSAYTDMTGTTHYNFSQSNFNDKKFLVVSGRCFINYGNFICMQESQYQERYNQILAGYGKAIVVNNDTTTLTPEQQQAVDELKKFGVVVNGNISDDPRLKACRDSINLFKQMQASYDKCVQEEDQRYIDSIKLKLSYLTGQTQQVQPTNTETKLQKDAACKQLGALYFDSAKGQCGCSLYKYFDTSLNKCVSMCPENQYPVNGVCKCNLGFVHHVNTPDKCIRCEDAVPNAAFNTASKKCECKPGREYNSATNACELTKNTSDSATKKIDDNKKIIPVTSDIGTVPAKSDDNSNLQENVTSTTEQKVLNTDNQVKNTNKVGNFFRNVNNALMGFFKKFKFW